MKTLYERLSDENKAKVEAQLLIYPTITQRLIDVLKEEVGVLQLSMYNATDLYSFIYPDGQFDLNKYLDLFEDKSNLLNCESGS